MSLAVIFICFISIFFWVWVFHLPFVFPATFLSSLSFSLAFSMAFGYFLCVLFSSLNEGSSSGTACVRVCDLGGGRAQAGKPLLLGTPPPRRPRPRSCVLRPPKLLLAPGEGRLRLCSPGGSLVFLPSEATGGLSVPSLVLVGVLLPSSATRCRSVQSQGLRRSVTKAGVFSSEARPWCGAAPEGSGVQGGPHPAVRQPAQPVSVMSRCALRPAACTPCSALINLPPGQLCDSDMTARSLGEH